MLQRAHLLSFREQWTVGLAAVVAVLIRCAICGITVKVRDSSVDNCYAFKSHGFGHFILTVLVENVEYLWHIVNREQ